MFKNNLILFFSLYCFLSFPVPSLSEQQQVCTGQCDEKQITLKEDTKVSVTLTQSISSANSAVGQPVQAEVANNVIVEDRVVIKKGTMVKGLISSIEGAKRLGKGGSISIQLTSVKAVDEQKISLRSAAGRSGSDKTGKTVAMTVLFGLPGLLVKGREAGIAKGSKIDAFVEEDVNVKSSIVASLEEDSVSTKVENKKQ